MQGKDNFLRPQLDSIRYAVAGLSDIFRTEHNARNHALCSVIVLLFSGWLHIDSIRLLLIIIAIALVWITEAFNTVLELVIDIVSPEYSETARRAKDIAAAAVLFAATGAVIIGILILGPPLLVKFGIPVSHT